MPTQPDDLRANGRDRRPTPLYHAEGEVREGARCRDDSGTHIITLTTLNTAWMKVEVPAGVAGVADGESEAADLGITERRI